MCIYTYFLYIKNHLFTFWRVHWFVCLFIAHYRRDAQFHLHKKLYSIDGVYKLYVQKTIYM